MEKNLDLNLLNTDSFKILQGFDQPDWGSNTLKFNEIKFEYLIKHEEIKKAIHTHITIMLLRKIFDVKNFDMTGKNFLAGSMWAKSFFNFANDLSLVKFPLELIVQFPDYSDDTSHIKIQIKKLEWSKIKIDEFKARAQNFINEAFKIKDITEEKKKSMENKITEENLKSYYDRLKGDKVVISI